MKASRSERFFARRAGEGAVGESGFTLIELMVTVSIIGILASVGLPSFIHYTRNAKVSEVHESLNPTQQVIKIVQAELTAMLGSEHRELNRSPLKPTVIMLTGLQGSGKTTTAGKLALHLKELGKSSLLCSFDLKRLAAEEQLETIARESGSHFFKSAGRDLPALARELRKNAADTGYDYVIADTAGRLHIDEELMEELRRVKEALQPAEALSWAGEVALPGQTAVLAEATTAGSTRLTNEPSSSACGPSR